MIKSKIIIIFPKPLVFHRLFFFIPCTLIKFFSPKRRRKLNLINWKKMNNILMNYHNREICLLINLNVNTRSLIVADCAENTEQHENLY